MLLVRKTFSLCAKIPRNHPFVTDSFHRWFHRCALLFGEVKLSPSEVTEILRTSEFSHEFNDPENCIKSYDSNQLPANSPIEDMRSEGKCLLTSTLVGVFDGHCGPACAQVVAKRLFEYICVGLLPNDLLNQYFTSLKDSKPPELVERFNENYELLTELKALYRKSFVKYVEKVISNRKENFCMEEALETAFTSLDEDITSEALNTEDSETNLRTVSVAMSGAVACVAHIDGSHLHVANLGDSRAVMGVLSEDNYWLAKEITCDHNAENIHEIKRIKEEHPDNEKKTVLTNGRLLGHLAPLRAFGDVRFKWSLESLRRIVVPYFGNEAIVSNYHTPPYLSAKPEISHYRLTSRDKFLIIGSDGLWEMLSPLQAVRLVGEHMRGKVVLNPFKVPMVDMKLKDIHDLLEQRKECFNVKPIDGNAATHLFRNALGGTDVGFEHSKLSWMLTLPKHVARCFRDDLTVAVIFFDSKYWRQVHR